ncbi:MAG: hypothetical protein L0287_05365, partial [Anaerolineae bacterium]|nr:hypothetical protein [Anaerolineae bacterium]
MNNKLKSSNMKTRQARAAKKKDVPQKTATEQLTGIIKSLGEWRDRALVIVGLLYAAGYFMWSWNALENNLGLLPALQFQYVVAGIGPVFIGITTIGGGLLVLRLLENYWLKKLETNTNPPWPFMRASFKIGTLIALGALIYSSLSPSVALAYAIGVVLYYLFIEHEKSWFRLWLGKRMTIIPYNELSDDGQVKRGRWAIVFFIAVVLV